MYYHQTYGHKQEHQTFDILKLEDDEPYKVNVCPVALVPTDKVESKVTSPLTVSLVPFNN